MLEHWLQVELGTLVWWALLYLKITIIAVIISAVIAIFVGQR